MNTNHTSGTQLIDRSLGLLPAEESYMISNNDYIQHLDKWKPGKNNILYVTGLSGSGKSTLAADYEKKYNAHMFELDGIQHNYDSSGKGILEKIKKKFPQYNDALNTWLKNNNGEINNEQYKLLKNISDYVISLCKEDSQTLYIIEGVQLFQWYDPETFNSKPIIIKGTSMMTSTIRGLLRDHKNNNSSIDLKMLARSFPKRFKWLNEDEHYLSKFKRGLESTLKSEITPDYKAKGKLSLSNFTARKIDKITDEMKSSLSFFKHIDSKRDTTYVWYDNQEIVGVGSVRYVQCNDVNYNWITAIQVNPKYKGYGLGKQILDFCVKKLKGDALTVAIDNKIALEMYKKYGFEISKESLEDVKAGRRKVYFMYLK